MELIILFAIVNLISFSLYGYDKLLAMKQRRRVSEKNLHTISLMGGFVGSTVAVLLFRHKIKKFKFMAILAVIWIVWMIGLVQLKMI